MEYSSSSPSSEFAISPFSSIILHPNNTLPPLPPLIPLQILDRDDVHISDLIPQRSRSKPKQKPSSITINVDANAPVKPFPIVPSPQTPHTRGKN